MEICKAPTLRLKALNKHTHILYIKMENVIQKKKKKKKYISTSVDKRDRETQTDSNSMVFIQRIVTHSQNSLTGEENRDGSYSWVQL